MKRTSIKELYTDAIDAKPKHFNFGEGYAETWDVVYPDVSSWDHAACLNWLNERGYDTDDYPGLDGAQEKCREVMQDDEAYAPMMNYLYPLPSLRHTPEAAQELVEHTSCVVVLIRDDDDSSPETPYLALAGGGMDLSWDICEAYMLLGYLPPFHYCSLPRYGGAKLTTKARWIIAGCKRSCSVLKRWADSKLNDLRHVRKVMAEQ